MMTNLGTQDRLVRASIGFLVLIGVLISPIDIFINAYIYYGAIVLGVMALLNSMTGMCVIFKIIGLNSCPMARALAEEKEAMQAMQA